MALRLQNSTWIIMTIAPGPGIRQAAVAIAVGRLPLYAHACRARQTARWMSRQIQVNSRSNRDGVATASAK